MSFLNVLTEGLALNISFFIDLFVSHPFWIFAFAAAAYFLYDKKILLGFPIVVFFVYLQVDWSSFMNWNFSLVVPVWLLLNIFFDVFSKGYRFLGKYSPYGAIGLFTIILIANMNFGILRGA